MITPNLRTVTLKLRRIDVIDLMIACLSTHEAVEKSEPNNTKWMELHDKLDEILKAFDEQAK